MSEYIFQEIRFSEPKNISEGHWLWVWNADKIPPHIGISRNDSYYSLTFKECELSLSSSKKLTQAKRAKTPLVLIKLSDSIGFSDFDKVFSAYTSAVHDKTTCLKPVLKVLTVTDNIQQLSELLKLLEKEQNMQEVFALNLTGDYKGIPAYSVTDIIKRIEQLHETNGRKHKA